MILTREEPFALLFLGNEHFRVYIGRIEYGAPYVIISFGTINEYVKPFAYKASAEWQMRPNARNAFLQQSGAVR